MTQYMAAKLYQLGIWLIIKAARLFRREDLKAYPEIVDMSFYDYVEGAYGEQLLQDVLKQAKD